ncbi:MAG: hypothetical protein H6732_17355 [Alphaproteobacteria bacterium]|nr:hypothetical protein [Alphaproteobacteria bacterium]
MALLGAALAGVLVRHGLTASFGVTLFTDRELLRGALFPAEGATLGAEMTGVGARLPGPLLGLLFALPRLVSHDPHAVFALQLGLAAVALLVVGLAVGRRLGPAAAAVALLAGVLPMPVQHTLAILWNPGFLPLPVALLGVGLLRLLHDRDARGLDLVVVGAALGAQVHASAGVLLVAALPAVALSGADGLGRRVPRALGWGALVLAPYAVGELLSGGANTRLLLSGGSRGAWSPGVAADHVAMLVGLWHARDLGLDGDGLRRALPLAVAAGGVLGAAWRWSRPGPAPAARAVAGTGLTLVLYLLALGLGPAPEPVPRYLLAAVPLLAVVLGGTVGAVLSVLEPTRLRPAAFVALAALAVGVAGGVPTPLGALLHPEVAGPGTWRELTAVIDAVRAHTGWTLQRTVGRTVWATRWADGTVTWGLGPAVGSLLHEAGTPFEGSGDPPCAVVLTDALEEEAAPLDAAVVLAGVAEDARVLETARLPGDRTLLLYARDGRRCPTSMVQRYVDLPREAALRTLWRDLPCREARALGAEGTRWALRLPARTAGGCEGSPPLVLEVAVEARPGELRATLHSAQLRGLADNGGWLSSAGVLRPTLRLHGAGGEAEVVIEPGGVGGRGPATPLASWWVQVPSGTWEAVLELSVVGGAPGPESFPLGAVVVP